MKRKLEDILDDEEYKDLVKAKAALYFIFGADREDLIQEGMIGLVKAYNSFDGSRTAAFKTYASHCIENEILNAIKAASRRKHAPLNESSEIPETLAAGKFSSPEEAVIFDEFWNNIRTNKDKVFAPFEHEVILHLMQGESYKEIEKALNKSPKQIDNAVQRIKLKIRKL